MNVARHAGLSGAEGLTIPTETPVAEAWATVEQRCSVDEDELVRIVASDAQLAIADLGAANATARRLVPDRIAQRYSLVPLRETDRQIVVATSDPSNLEAEQAVGFASGRRVTFEIASPAAIHAALAVSVRQSALAHPTPAIGSVAIPAPPVRPLAADGTRNGSAHADAAMVKIADEMLQEAARLGASDVQLEPGTDQGTIRFRIDGVYRRYTDLAMPDFERVLGRVKGMARLATMVRNRPQEGRAHVRLDSIDIDLRVATVPTRDGEKATLRLPACSEPRSLDELGLFPSQCAALRDLAAARSGMILIAGPQGSGRTTTTYALARELLTRGVAVTMIEDPVEQPLPTATQIQVDLRNGLTFSAAVRNAIGESGKALIIGELRDRETADAAAQAAIAGHLVIAAIQSSGAIGAIDRLGELGLGRTRTATVLRGVIAQQLVRRVCNACAQRIDVAAAPHPPAPGAATGNGHAPAVVVRARGCMHCGETGFRGRVPVAEVITASHALAELIADGAPPSALHRHIATIGVRVMRDAALDLVRRGSTTVEEVERVLGPSAVQSAQASELPMILVADDDPLERHLACALLEKHGFRTTEADDGNTAIAQLTPQSRFAAVILDLHMPTLDGREVLRHIRQSSQLMSTPVIVLTGYGEAETEVELIDAGADDYLAKPIDPPRFIARVKAALRRAVV